MLIEYSCTIWQKHLEKLSKFPLSLGPFGVIKERKIGNPINENEKNNKRNETYKKITFTNNNLHYMNIFHT